MSISKFLQLAAEFAEAHDVYEEFRQAYEMYRSGGTYSGRTYGVLESCQKALDDQDLLVSFYTSLAFCV